MGGKVRTRLIEEALRFLEPGEAAELRVRSSEALRGALAGQAPGWIPIELFGEAVQLIADIRRTEDGASWALGKFVAANEVGPVHSLAARVLRPSMIVSLAPSLFTTHFQDAGRVSVRVVGERTLVVTVSDFPVSSAAACAVIGGWMEGWLALGPRSKISVKHTACRSDGASACEYTGSWED